MNDSDVLLDRLVESVRQTLAQRSRIPDSTYRLQFHAPHLTFRDGAALAPYLEKLGVSHVYASPCLKARPGSAHGYDVVDYSMLNPELGTPEDHAAMVESLHRHGLGQLLDIVPNHMSIACPENPFWFDVLENGASSPFAGYFDINWHPIKAELDNKILLPLLEDQYGRVLEAGLLRLQFAEGAFSLHYHDWRLPLEPRTYPLLLAYRLDALKAALGTESAELHELESIITALEYLPQTSEADPQRIAERQREKEVIKGRLRRLAGECAAIGGFIGENVRRFNGDSADPRSFDPLDALLNAQVFRLSHWKAAADEINYRRFFDISELAAVRTEDPAVFAASHRLIFDMLARGDVDGLRIDHVDGLYDPLDYLRRVQQGYVRAVGRLTYERMMAAGGQTAEQPAEPSPEFPPWDEIEPRFNARTEREASGPGKAPLFVVVEKILGPEEPLPDDWPAAGTTGYDALNFINRLLMDPAGLAALAKIYSRFTDQRIDFRDVAHRSRMLVLRTAMASELQMLAHQLNRISERHRSCRDFTLNTLRVALRDILTWFPIYRTYIRHGAVDERDRQFIVRAAAQARWHNRAMNPDVFDFIRDVLLLEQPPNLDEAGHQDRELFVGRFQQLTSPLIAKGIEDTAFYVHFPLASLNEVGADPASGAMTLADFHRENAARLARQPGSLVATTTHDTKRSEDTRARIDVLSEIPHLWRTAINRWARINRRRRREVDGLPAPSRNDEYLFYQTLVGIWPLERSGAAAHEELVGRVQQYMAKAAHEAKERTSWINPNPDYDLALRDFIAAALDDHPKNRFLAELRAFHERVVDWGLYNALSQAFLKLAIPGVPDIYQGQELWDFSLVDPDNRRPVDFACRQEMLERMAEDLSGAEDSRLEYTRLLGRNPRDPRLKLFVTWQMLQFRRTHSELFREGRYLPLTADGERGAHLCAFAWRWTPPSGGPEQIAIAVAPRLWATLAGGFAAAPDSGSSRALAGPDWAGTLLSLGDLQEQPLRNLFTGQQFAPAISGLQAADLLSDFPVAWLTNIL